MKKIYKSIFLFLMAMAIAASFTFCSKEKDKGAPSISYVRVTKPTSSDSLLSGATQGSLIAIIGENLQGAKQIWFNNLQATLTPTYITNTTILVNLPSKAPTIVTNTLKIIFANGDSLKYHFIVEIHAPVIKYMECEFVPDGGIAAIHGDYFYEPLTVTFPEGGVAELVSVQDQIIKVKVPGGSQAGQIIVKNNFGTTLSDLMFRDNRNIFISSDPFSGWWNSDFVIAYPGTTDVPAINGNYIRVKKVVDSDKWMEVAGGPASAMGDISKNIPDEAIQKPYLYNFKFEVNTVLPYNTNLISFNVGLTGQNDKAYAWNPPFDTKGQWQTVVIPYEEMVAAYIKNGSTMAVSSTGYWSRILFFGKGALNCDISFDNFRLVPKLIKQDL